MAKCSILRIPIIALLAACAAASSCAAKPTTLLFVGNSITYAGNLPKVFEALCDASNKRCSTEMIAEGGATLTQRVEDETLSRSLQGRRFDYLVLQERGGDYIALPEQRQFQQQAEDAAEKLVSAARNLRLKPVLLGTYQGYAAPSEQLVKAEIALASKLDVPVISVSNHFLCGRSRFPDLRWLDPDGMHPGPELTLLMAVLLYRELFGAYPSESPISIRAPIYGPRNGPRSNSFASSQSAPADAPSTSSYDVTALRLVVETAKSCAGDA